MLCYRQDVMILITSSTLRQATELFLKIKKIMRDFPRSPKLIKSNSNTIETEGDGRCVCVPGKGENVAGYSAVDLLVIDEASYSDDKLYSILRPMLMTSKGRMILISTPFIREGFFFDVWMHGGEEWSRYEVPAIQCPRVTQEFLDSERSELGDWWYRSQYECQFQDAQGQVFRSEWLQRAIDPTSVPIFGEQEVTKRRHEGVEPLFSPAEYGRIKGVA